MLVLKEFGPEAAESIEWSSPRLPCIAGDFTKLDQHAVQQINRNIELIRYPRPLARGFLRTWFQEAFDRDRGTVD